MMQKRNSDKKRLVIAFVVIGIIAAVSVFALLNKKPSNTKAATELKKDEQKVEATKTEPDTSDHLKISKINVDAKIVPVGVTKEGNMDVPGSIYTVGWYNKGAKPGAPGTAVLAGHLDSASGEAGVFANLNKLVAGDIIKVTTPDGKETGFKVTKSKVYGATDKPTEVFTSKSGAHLNLITCTGSWDKNKSEYDKRLVVFTELAK